jgi:hypothetical protein
MANQLNERVSPIFNGFFTITSPTGEHRTFRIHTQPDAESQLKRGRREPFAPGKRIISLLVGPDNGRDYKGFGFVTDDGISVWRKFARNNPRADATTHEKYANLVWSLATDGENSPFYRKGARLLFEGRCIKCNRRLTEPTSIKLGIGPECRSKTD